MNYNETLLTDGTGYEVSDVEYHSFSCPKTVCSESCSRKLFLSLSAPHTSNGRAAQIPPQLPVQEESATLQASLIHEKGVSDALRQRLQRNPVAPQRGHPSEAATSSSLHESSLTLSSARIPKLGPFPVDSIGKVDGRRDTETKSEARGKSAFLEYAKLGRSSTPMPRANTHSLGDFPPLPQILENSPLPLMRTASDGAAADLDRSSGLSAPQEGHSSLLHGPPPGMHPRRRRSLDGGDHSMQVQNPQH